MNAIERMIGAVAPGWALNRARSRAAWRVVQALELRGGYDAASTGRRAGKWVAGSGSANAEIAPALSRVRARSRDMVRNNPYARSAITKLVARAIGTGIMARPTGVVKPVWEEFVEQSDFEGQHDLYGQMSLMGRTVFESGECLVRRIRTRNRRMPLQIQVLEPDYLDDLKFGPLDNGNFAIAGIEVDPTGRRVAYWLYDHHPGETVLMPKTWASRRVAASEILHIYEKERPGQLRGMPRMAASLMRLRDVDEYQDAQMMRKKIEACFAAFVKTPTGTSAPLVGGDDVTTNSETGRREETMRPGMIWYGRNGEEVTFGSPGGASRDEYTNDQLHAIAAGAGVTYEQMTGDYSQVTYLSSRAAQIELRSLVEMFQWIHFIPMGCRGIWRWFVEDAGFNAGRFVPDDATVGWTPPRWYWIDPSKDVAAAKEEVSGGFIPLSEKQRELGLDPDEVIEEFAAERKKHQDKGLVFDTDASHEVKAKAAAAGKPEDTPPAPKKPAEDRSIVVNVSPPSVNFAEGAFRAGDTNVTVPERQVTLEATIQAPPSPDVLVDVNVKGYPQRTEETIERGADKEITRITREAKD